MTSHNIERCPFGALVPPWGLACASLVLSGCSLLSADRVQCSTNAECRDAFASQFPVCGPLGYCVDEGVAPIPRCTKTFPERLLEPNEFPDAVMFGSIVERGFDGDAVLEDAAELAIFQANEAGGLDGRSFGMVFCDMTENPDVDGLTLDEAAAASATWLANDLGVPAIFGPTTSGTTELVFEATRDAGTTLMSPSATSPTLTLLDQPTASDTDPGRLWRTVPPDSLQGRIMAQDMIGRGVTQVAVVTEQGSYGEGLQSFFLDNFRSMGGSTVGELALFSSSSERDAAIVDVGNRAAAEVLFISGEISDAIAFLNAAASQAGFSGKTVFLTDTSKTEDIFTETGAGVASSGLLQRTRLTAPSPGQGSVYETFVGSFAARFPRNPREFGFVPQAYDAVWLLIYGAAWSLYQDGGGVTPRGIARGMRRTTSGSSIVVSGGTWPTVRSAFQSGTGVDLDGSSGSLAFDPETEELLDADIDVLAVRARCAGGFTFEEMPVGVIAPTDCQM